MSTFLSDDAESCLAQHNRKRKRDPEKEKRIPQLTNRASYWAILVDQLPPHPSRTLTLNPKLLLTFLLQQKWQPKKTTPATKRRGGTQDQASWRVVEESEK